MQITHRGVPSDKCRYAFRGALSAVVLLAGAALANTSAAAEIELLGTGTFKPLVSERMANIPPGLPFSKTDLTSGTWAFALRYEDRTGDSDPDPYVGRYTGAVRSLRVTVGSTTVELPVDRSEIVVSDGGLGFTERESIRLEVTSHTPYGMVRVSWIQSHQTGDRVDLRGSPGLLAGDALPSPSLVANLPTDRRFDRFLLLRVDSPRQLQPLLYLSSSTLAVSARPFAAP
jgi:hypothetical protein